ncbi:hypothetical protein BJQ94_14380 [Cryobacterium sp. SO2]|uniref:hypothetical protein n=1 Tax=Cryobacterium sp. SO2 TaxID=1897060 RepID=UPI00223CDBA8|nr:hypothetical protein [Cryobacterium sp. SO2]WEO76542.1 hypothetical protein BJQ94_14380 [Cryobacterium sp. SO2]
MTDDVTDDVTDAVTAPVPGLVAPAADAPAPRRPGRRRLARAGILLAVVALLSAGFWGWSVAGENRQIAAESALTTQLDEQTDAFNAHDARLRNTVWLAGQVHSVVDSAAFAGDTLAEAGALREALAAADRIAEEQSDAEPAADDDLTTGAGYRPPWATIADAERLEGLTRDSRRSEDRLLTAATDVTATRDSLDDAEAAYFTAAATRAEQTISTDALSNRSLQVALLRLAEQAREPTMVNARDGVFLAALMGAEEQVRASQALNEARRADPALAVRSEIEDYARSLSNGVALEFVWAEEVSGLGHDWLSGTAETYDTDGGWSIISLNYTIEEVWYDGPEAHALVAHEVGHAQVYRETCWPLFSGATFEQDQETWATAWSMSQGFDAGSGVEAYGRPSDEQVAVAGQCR